MIIIDVECYKNYFLLAALSTETQNVKTFELHADCKLDRGALSSLMSRKLTGSFNGNGYDLPIIAAAIAGATNAELKKISDGIIKSKQPAWRVLRDLKIEVPKNWNHIDCLEVAQGQASLKIYGGRLGAKKLQDLPIEPDDLITPEQRELMRAYCVNDLKTTELLFNTLSKQIKLREQMGAKYGMDLRSKSDAQIAETIILSELKAVTGKSYRPANLPDDFSFHYQNPKIVSFDSENLTAIFNRILKTPFALAGNGSVTLPDFLKREKVKVGGVDYQMGIGGLHSCEKSQYIKPAADELLFDLDVASYYPNIILQQNLSPTALGAPFLRLYKAMVTERIAAKNSGDKVKADTLKICLNGSFGKLGSKYSALFAPELLLQTTMTGQLCLLMLIERITATGARIVSANTDGIVILCKKALQSAVMSAAFDWELDTTFTLERTDYAAIASRDVNNYVAVKVDGSTKGKGVFTGSSISKNPNGEIIFEAVAQTIAQQGNAQTVKNIICNSTDIKKFLTVRKVQGGAVWRGEKLGRAVRFYNSLTVKSDESIHYLLNNNRVPNSAGCKPRMDLPDTLPNDIDYHAYVVAAEKLLCEVGYV